jgi:hypothetical protein
MPGELITSTLDRTGQLVGHVNILGG